MLITYDNYKQILPSDLWDTFRLMADRARGSSILFINGSLIFSR